MPTSFNKRCFACQKVKSVRHFYRSNVRYFQKECKRCCRLRKRRWHQTESGKLSSANTKLKRRFGITLIQYEYMLAIQKGLCAICGVDMAKNSQGHRLGVDHDHATGKVRGILCKPRNTAIGGFHDSPGLCERGAEYLRHAAGNH